MFVYDLFKLQENSNEEYYAVYNQRGKPMIMRKPVGKTARAYAEEKNLIIKGGPFGSHQETESFWIRSVFANKRKEVDEQAPINVPKGWEAKTQPDGSTRISKIGSMSSAEYKQNMADYKAKNWTPEKIADYSQRMASGQGYTDAERQANLQQQQQHFGKYADTGDLKETEPTANQPRTTMSDERKAQLRKDINAVDYNKEQQPSAAPSAEQRAGIRQAVSDYKEKEKVKEQDDFPNEKTLKQQEQDRWSHYDAAKKAAQGEILGREVDGKVISIPPGHPEYDETFDDLYRQQNPGYPTPNDPGFYLTPFRYPGEPEPAYTKALVEGGPFSYGAKKPRKGSVADLAAQKRKEQERGKQPVEPRDQMVGVAKIVKEFAPSGGGGGRWYSDDQLYEIIGEDWLEAFDVSGDRGNIDLNGERARLFLAQEAEAWLTDRGYRVNVLDVRDDGDELSWYIQGPLYQGLDEDWKKVNRKDRTPGMSRKAVKAYRRENPGSKLQTAVTTKPSKLKKGSKSAKRRKSFCARMKGMKRAHAGAKTKRNPDSPINKALRRWNCESVEEMRDLIMIAEQRISAMREGGFDIPEIPRAPQPRPEPKNKTSEDASKYMDTKPSSVTAKQADELGAMARKAFRPDLNPDYYKDNEPVRPRRNWDYSDPDVQPIVKQWMDKNLIDRKPMTYQNGDEDIDEGSVQDKLHRRHQDLRKKRGAPNPEYYKELKTTFDLPNDERWQKTAELKKKYKVTNEDVEKYLEEMNRAGYEIVTESATLCPECGGAAYADRMLAEKQDACYHKVKSRYKVWPSAYASGALVRCRKKGAANWGNKSKK